MANPTYARAIAREFQGSLDQMVREAELDEVKRHIDRASSFNVENEIHRVVDPMGELQRSLNEHHHAGLAVDGKFGPLTKKALQRALGVTADGIIGPQTVRALQRHVGAAVDGQWGPDTTRHLQTALNADRF